MSVVVIAAATPTKVCEASSVVSVKNFHSSIKKNNVSEHPHEVGLNKEDNHEADPAKQEIIIV